MPGPGIKALARALALGSAAATAAADSLLIKGGTVANADQSFVGDVLVEDGLIVDVRKGGITPPAGWKGRTIDATGKFVMPGGIDLHTHLEMPFMGQVACDDFQSGQEAALAGGTTMHIDFALPDDHDMAAGYETYRKKSAKSVMDYGFHMAVTKWNDKTAEDLVMLTGKGINSFKFFLAYKGALMVTDEEFIYGLEQCKKAGALAMVHAENGEAVVLGQKKVFEAGITGPEGHALSRPAVLEGEATARAIKLAKWVNTPLYVVHVMSKDALDEVAKAKMEGLRVIGEPVASGLFWDESKMWDPDFKVAAQYVMSPPIRGPGHKEALQAALASGALQIVATDHAVFNSTQKALGKDDFNIIPNGVNGIEERVHITWHTMVASGLMTPSDFVRATSADAAKAFNIYPQKGLLAPGSDADIMILDPAEKHTISAKTHHSRMDTNIYEGVTVEGKVTTTISQGKVVWENGKLNTVRGAGRFIEMKPFGPLFDGLDKADAAKAAAAKAPVDRSQMGGKSEL